MHRPSHSHQHTPFTSKSIEQSCIRVKELITIKWKHQSRIMPRKEVQNITFQMNVIDYETP